MLQRLLYHLIYLHLFKVSLIISIFSHRLHCIVAFFIFVPFFSFIPATFSFISSHNDTLPAEHSMSNATNEATRATLFHVVEAKEK